MYDGTVLDEQRFIVIGGDADSIRTKIETGFTPNLSLKESAQLAITALSSDDRKLTAHDLEVAVLQRNGARRCFKRISDQSLEDLLK